MRTDRRTMRQAGEAARCARASLAAALAGLVLLVLAPSSAVAAAGDQLFVFGFNGYGELGTETNAGSAAPNPTPTSVSLPGASGPTAQAAVGKGYSLATTSTGQLYSFGENFYGQLGVPTNVGTSTPNLPALVTLAEATGPVVEVAAGEAHSLAVTSTGQLYGFGKNEFGQLGTTTNNKKSNANPTPTLVHLPGEEGGVTQVAVGPNHSLAVTSTGQLYAFGRNRYGELGSPTNNGTNEPNPAPTLVGLPGATGPVTAVAAGEAFSLAVTSTGQLYAFGENFSGQLGNASDNESTARPAHPTPTPVALPGAIGPVTQVAAGASHTLAVTGSGQLYAFGNNYGGQLGNPTNTGGSPAPEANPTPTRVSLPGATGPVTQVGGGYSFSLALTASGQLYAFGLNEYGQLGSAINNGTAAANPTPAVVLAPAGMTFNTLGHGSYAQQTLVIAGPTPVPAPPLASTLPPATTPIASLDPFPALAARIKASLLAQLTPRGKGAKIGRLSKKKGYTMSFTALAAGTAVINWYFVPKGAHLSKAKPLPVLVASARKTFAGAGKLRMTIKLTAKGVRLVRKAKRIKLTAKGSFSVPGHAPVTAIKSFTLLR
jgi:alpha-tubulin suppressor-like RCC1 family protein